MFASIGAHHPIVVLCILSLSAYAQTAPEACGPSFVVDGYRDFQHVGTSVGFAGDWDSDGLADVFVGSSGPLSVNDGGPLGEVCVYSGLGGRNPIRCWYGDQTWAGFAQAARAGDVDGDLVLDVIITAAGYHGPAGWQAGRVYLISGNNNQFLHVWDGPNEYGWFGISVDGGHDFNGDDVPDIVIGETGVNSGLIEFPGKVYVFSGATKELIRTWTGEYPADHFGSDLAVLRDFDGDGRADVLVGAPWNTPGKAYVFSGATGEQLWFRAGDTNGGVFGAAVASAGDINGDGSDDLIIGDYYHDGPSGPGSSYGQAYLFTSPHGELLHTWVGETWEDFFGFAVSGAGDVNADGISDVVVGAYSHVEPESANSGKAYVYSGASGSLLWSSNGEGGSFGITVDSAGDVDGDGRMEVIVGAAYHDAPYGLFSGRAYIYTPVPADCDCNGSLNLNDIARFSYCMSGVSFAPPSIVCYCADLDSDEDVDLRDFVEFQLQFSNVP